MHPHAATPAPQPEPFDFSDSPPADPLTTARTDTLHALHQFIVAHVLRPAPSGAIPPPRTIAARLVVLQLLIEPHHRHSLRYYAKGLGVSPAALSLIGLEFAARLGLRAPWQRSDQVREAYASRARAVHKQQHTPCERTQRSRERASASPEIKAKLDAITRAEHNEAVTLAAAARALGPIRKHQTHF